MDGAEAVAKLVGVFFILALISPDVRQILGALAVLLVGVGLAVLIGFVLFRVIVRGLQKPEVRLPLPESSVSISSHLVRLGPPRTEALSSKVDSSRPRDSTLTSSELIDHLRAMDWFQFEKVVALAYKKLGYAVTRRGGANPDGGIDLVIEKDGRRSAVQCKQWKTWNLGVRAVREFLGALTDAGMQQGVFVTLRGYTADARQLADKHGIEILNEAGLAAMLESTNARFDPETLQILKDTRKFCPKCEREMLLRTATKGRDSGQEFWGCSGFPKCRFTLSV